LLKGWFGGGGKKQAPENYSIDDLVVLERYQEAADRLRDKLKANPQDLHSRLKLAEVYTQLKQLGSAADEYAFVADEYAQDGFYDKGIALLMKALKLAPEDASLRGKINQLEAEKRMDHVRALAIEGLRQAGGDGTSTLELQRLWHHLAASSLVRRLQPDQLKRLISLMKLVHLKGGTVLVEQGDQRPELFLIVRGVVDAYAEGVAGREAPVKSFSSGDVLGEAALLEKAPWPARYRVSEATVVLCLSREGLENALKGNSDPRGFLEMLREQRHDRDVATTVRNLRAR
jgi:tetratricopeptide (TPR) repeat protein